MGDGKRAGAGIRTLLERLDPWVVLLALVYIVFGSGSSSWKGLCWGLLLLIFLQRAILHWMDCWPEFRGERATAFVRSVLALVVTTGLFFGLRTLAPYMTGNVTAAQLPKLAVEIGGRYRLESDAGFPAQMTILRDEVGKAYRITATRMDDKGMWLGMLQAELSATSLEEAGSGKLLTLDRLGGNFLEGVRELRGHRGTLRLSANRTPERFEIHKGDKLLYAAKLRPLR